MKRTIIILISLILTQLSFGQSMDELMKMWNLEIARVGDRFAAEINFEIDNLDLEVKELISTDYSQGQLRIYRQDESIKKMTRTYTVGDTAFSEDYYFLGFWPVYVELNKSYQDLPDKFYFDKSNLMLWITDTKEQLTVKNNECSKWWYKLAKSMDRLKIIANSPESKINEDEVKPPEPPPKTKEDSLELIRLNEELEKLMNQIPDSLKK